jgi:hypothetical protein
VDGITAPTGEKNSIFSDKEFDVFCLADDGYEFCASALDNHPKLKYSVKSGVIDDSHSLKGFAAFVSAERRKKPFTWVTADEEKNGFFQGRCCTLGIIPEIRRSFSSAICLPGECSLL